MNITNVYNLPEPFVNAYKSEYTYTPKRYSVTTILRGTCEALLKRRHDAEVEMDASDMVWMVFGTAVHKVFEEAKAKRGQHKEMRVEMEIPDTDGYVLSGIIDLYDDETGVITDYKTASVWKAIKNDWEDYRKQLLYYAVLLNEGGYNPKRGLILAIFKDWTETDKRGKPDYPPHPVTEVWWDFSDDDIAAAKEEIIGKFQHIIACEDIPDEALEPCSAKERWERPAKYAVMKNENKTATKLCDSEDEAKTYIEWAMQTAKKGTVFNIVRRPGEQVKCTKYCTVKKWCPYYQKELANGEQ